MVSFFVVLPLLHTTPQSTWLKMAAAVLEAMAMTITEVVSPPLLSKYYRPVHTEIFWLI